MMKRKWTWVLLFAGVLGLGVGCGGDDNDDNTAGSSGGGAGMMSMAGRGTSGSGGSGGGSGVVIPDLVEDDKCVNRGEVNLECPPVEPLEGACAPRGACCHRSSNYAKEQRLGPNDPLELEYRVNFSATANHAITIGDPFLTMTTTTRYENEQQSLLWRFVLPRMNGEEVSGMGMTTIGVGRFNCDGTYSFYNDTAAPTSRASSTMPLDDCPSCSGDASRWRARDAMVKVDVTKHGIDRIKPVFAGNPNRGYTITPFLDSTTFVLDWELINSGFEFLELDLEGEENRDCVGKRDGTTWMHDGTFIVYTPLEENSKDIINILAHNYCQLVAFGILGEGMKDMSCLETARCMPDGPDPMAGPCEWEKLPDALCPTAAERDNWGCHLGAEGNPNMEEGYPSDAQIACTQEAPTGSLDPDMGATSKGQCCDPMGMSTTLPACNAYRLVQRFVAAAAEITDDLAGEVQQDWKKCPGR